MAPSTRGKPLNSPSEPLQCGPHPPAKRTHPAQIAMSDVRRIPSMYVAAPPNIRALFSMDARGREFQPQGGCCCLAEGGVLLRKRRKQYLCSFGGSSRATAS